MRTLVAWLPIALAASGCSLYRFQEHRLDGWFTKAGLEERTVTLGDAEVRYWIGGEGPPLLLLHGFGGDGELGWWPQLILAQTHTLIVPDLLWFGQSTSTATPSIREEARAFLALLDHEGIERTDVAGISYGGLVTWMLVQEHPERFDRVALVDTPGNVWTAADQAAMLQRMGVGDAAEVVIPDGPDDVRGLLDLAYHEPPRVPGFLLRDVYRHGFTDQVEEKRLLLAELQGLLGEGGAQAWSRVPPTLVLWGEHDPLFPLEVGQRLAASLQAGLVVIEDADHAPNIEHPEPFNEALRTFLAHREVVAR